MADTVIGYPILNSPYVEPKFHSRLGDDPIANEIADVCHSCYSIVPTAKPEKKRGQPVFDTERARDTNCHVSYIIANQNEHLKVEQTLDEMLRIIPGGRNEGLNFAIYRAIHSKHRESYLGPNAAIHFAAGPGDLTYLAVQAVGASMLRPS